MSLVTRLTVPPFFSIISIGLLATFIGWGIGPFVDSWENKIYDWEMATDAGTFDHSSILILGIDDSHTGNCGSGILSHRQLAWTITALSQAGATAIAPIFPIQDQAGFDCQDPMGEAQLIEATAQSGIVVFPSNVPPMVASQAHAIGHAHLTPDSDGIMRHVSPFLMEDGSMIPALGLAIAGAGGMKEKISSLESTNHTLRIRYPASRHSQPFPYISFSQAWKLINTKQWEPLSQKVRGKFVLLIPVTPETSTIRTSWGTQDPEGFFHAAVLQNTLSNTWLLELPSAGTVLLLFGLAVPLAWVGWTKRPTVSLIVLCTILLIYVVFALIVFSYCNVLLPVLPAGVTGMLAMGGSAFWIFMRKRSTRLVQAAQTLSTLQVELGQKESLASRLKEEVVRVQNQIQQSARHIQGLEELAAAAQLKWDQAQTEVGKVRQRIQDLERELQQLRGQSLAIHSSSQEQIGPDEELLIQECTRLGILTRDPQVLKVFRDARKAAGSSNPILLLGETGTGKEVFAKAIHQLSHQQPGPFIPVNMTAIRPELFESELFGHTKGAFTGAIGRKGFFEEAHRGTIFLDEVGDLLPELQAKLLRVLEDGTLYRVGESKPTTVQVRVIAATNRDLQKEVEAGRFRADLYYRLRSVVLTLPPLRRRSPDDLKVLCAHFLHTCHPASRATPLTCSEGAWQAILRHTWPGNIRELRQTLSQAISLCQGPLITEADLNLEISQTSPLPSPVPQQANASIPFESAHDGVRWEDEAVLRSLRTFNFDMQATARALKWDRSTVTQRLKGLCFQSLIVHQGNVTSAAAALAGNDDLTPIVENKMRGYYANLISSTEHCSSVEAAIALCRRRLKNLPDRHFPAVERLIQCHFLHHRQTTVIS